MRWVDFRIETLVLGMWVHVGVGSQALGSSWEVSVHTWGRGYLPEEAKVSAWDSSSISVGLQVQASLRNVFGLALMSFFGVAYLQLSTFNAGLFLLSHLLVYIF